jgi:hypothetical protein
MEFNTAPNGLFVATRTDVSLSDAVIPAPVERVAVPIREQAKHVALLAKEK